MQLARVVGTLTGTVKHESLTKARLLVIQFLGASEQPDGEPVVAVDVLGAGRGDRVMVVNDGAILREILQSKSTPARWLILGLCD